MALHSHAARAVLTLSYEDLCFNKMKTEAAAHTRAKEEFKGRTTARQCLILPLKQERGINIVINEDGLPGTSCHEHSWKLLRNLKHLK